MVFQLCFKLYCAQGLRADKVAVEEEKDEQFEDKLKHNARLCLFQLANAVVENPESTA